MTKQPLPPITKIAERLLCDIEQSVRGFARYHKYSLGSDLRSQAMTVVRMCHRAWRERAQQSHWINELVWAIDELKLSLQLGSQLHALLTMLCVRHYASLVVFNSTHGIGVPDSQGPKGRTSQRLFCGHRSARRYDGLGRRAFGLAGSLTRYANPVQSVTRGLASSGDGFHTQSRSAIMANTSLIPSSVSVFKFQAHSVRTLTRDGEPWFVATDVAEALGYRDAANAARNLSANQRGTQIVSTLGGSQSVAVINESGLYRLVLRSRKPEAVAFSDWVTGEVLPAIRKTGRYETTHAQGDLLEPSYMAESRRKLLDWADAVRAGSKAAFPELDEQTVAGMMGFALQSARFLVVLGDDGRISLTSIPHDACVMTQEQMLKAIHAPNGLMISTPMLAKFAAASAQRLADRIERAQP